MSNERQITESNQMIGNRLDTIQRRALIVGAIGIVLSVLGLLLDPEQFYRSYLFGYIFWVAMALGCLAIVMIHHLTSGDWGILIRRPLEAGALTLPLLGLLFIPLIFGLPYIYVWARPEIVAADELLQHKQAYLNVPSFLLRTAIYFIVWTVLAYLLRRWSVQQDRTGNLRLLSRLQRLSAGGLVVFGLTVTFALIDRIMSLSPNWYSSIYGAMVAMGAVLEAFAFIIFIVFLLVNRGLLGGIVTPQLSGDLGSLLLAFVILWSYLAFSQFLLVWAGNLAEEIPWYLRRLNGGWTWVALAIVIFNFILPFVLLLSRGSRRSVPFITAVALLVIFIRMVDVFWLIAPEFYDSGLLVHWLDITTVIGIGGLWLAAYIWLLKRQTLLPIGDPRLARMLEHEVQDVGNTALSVQ